MRLALSAKAVDRNPSSVNGSWRCLPLACSAPAKLHTLSNAAVGASPASIMLGCMPHAYLLWAANCIAKMPQAGRELALVHSRLRRSEEHTSELQSHVN